VVALSAVSGENCGAFVECLDELLSAERNVINLKLPQGDGAAISWLYRHADVLNRDDRDEFAHFEVSIAPDQLARFEKTQLH
jgi:GTP-binding protein HflX